MPPDPGADGRVRAVTRKLIVEADGGSRGNPGPAGFGALDRDPATGEVLREVCDSIGTATNNVAEYSGLIAALRAAAAITPGARRTRLPGLARLVTSGCPGRATPTPTGSPTRPWMPPRGTRLAGQRGGGVLVLPVS